MSRFSLLLLFALFLSFSFVTAPPARAVNCDVNRCIAECQKQNPQGAAGRTCNSSCGFLILDRQKKGLCK